MHKLHIFIFLAESDRQKMIRFFVFIWHRFDVFAIGYPEFVIILASSAHLSR